MATQGQKSEVCSWIVLEKLLKFKYKLSGLV